MSKLVKDVLGSDCKTLLNDKQIIRLSVPVSGWIYIDGQDGIPFWEHELEALYPSLAGAGSLAGHHASEISKAINKARGIEDDQRTVVTWTYSDSIDLNGWTPLLNPFVCGQVRKDNGQKVISYGVSSFGYDARLAPKVKLFTNVNSSIIDPKAISDDCFVDVDGSADGYVIIPPNSYALGHTVEYFDMPRDLQLICLGKSTYARAGLIVNVTPIEPEFKGQVVIEISNSTPLPAKVYVNEGIAQFMFFHGEGCEVSYNDRDGKYQNQTGITLPRV